MAISDYAPVGLGNSGARGGSSFTCKEAHKVAVDNPGVGHGFGPASEATRDRGGLNRGRPLGWQIGKGMARSGGWRIVGRERTTGRKARENWRGRPSDQVLQSSETVDNEEEKFFFHNAAKYAELEEWQAPPNIDLSPAPVFLGFGLPSSARPPPVSRPALRPIHGGDPPFSSPPLIENDGSPAHPSRRTPVIKPIPFGERRFPSPTLSGWPGRDGGVGR